LIHARFLALGREIPIILLMLRPFPSLCLFLTIVALAGRAETVTLTKSAMLKAERNIVSLKAGTVVELLARDDQNLTVRFNEVTGKIPVASIAGTPAAAKPEPKKTEAKKPEAKKPETAKPAPPPRKAESTYGKAVEKARQNADKREKGLVKPTDEILGK